MNGGDSQPGVREVPAANCAVCGKSLRGIGPDGACSNCGTPAAMSQRPMAKEASGAAPLKLTNLGQVVADDRPCLVCGYNLKAITTGGKCPECGTPVNRSLQGDLLKYSAPEYAATLRRGITLVEVAIGLGILLILGNLVATVIMANKAGMFQFGIQGIKSKGVGTTGPVVHGLVYERVKELLKMAVVGLSLLGWWLFSTQDPGLAERDPAHRSRQVLRVFLTLSAIASGVTFLTTFVPSLMTQANAASGGILSGFTVNSAVNVLSYIAFLVGFVATLTYMIHLARRVPDAGLQKRADLYRWLLPLIAVLGIPLCFTGPVAAFAMYVVLIDEWRRRLGRLNEAVMQEDLGVGA